MKSQRSVIAIIGEDAAEETECMTEGLLIFETGWFFSGIGVV